MPRYITIPLDQLEVGQQITAWWKHLPSAGQGGIVEDIDDAGITLLAGTDRHRVEIGWVEIHHVTLERFLDADECVEYHRGDCAGVVDYCPAPSGSTIPRCQHHNDQRWDEYQRSETQQCANSNVAPPWYDESLIGERFFEEG